MRGSSSKQSAPSEILICFSCMRHLGCRMQLLYCKCVLQRKIWTRQSMIQSCLGSPDPLASWLTSLGQVRSVWWYLAGQADVNRCWPCQLLPRQKANDSISAGEPESCHYAHLIYMQKFACILMSDELIKKGVFIAWMTQFWMDSSDWQLDYANCLSLKHQGRLFSTASLALVSTGAFADQWC